MPPKYCTDARNHRIATLPLSPSDQIPSAALFGLKKYIQKSGQICFALWRIFFCIFEKCILKFYPIAAATLPLSPSDEVPSQLDQTWAQKAANTPETNFILHSLLYSTSSKHWICISVPTFLCPHIFFSSQFPMLCVQIID